MATFLVLVDIDMVALVDVGAAGDAVSRGVAFAMALDLSESTPSSEVVPACVRSIARFAV